MCRFLQCYLFPQRPQPQEEHPGFACPGPSSTSGSPPHTCNSSWGVRASCQESFQSILSSLVPLLDLAHCPFLLTVKTLLDPQPMLYQPRFLQGALWILLWWGLSSPGLENWSPSQLSPQLASPALPSCEDSVPLSSGSPSPGASCVHDWSTCLLSVFSETNGKGALVAEAMEVCLLGFICLSDLELLSTSFSQLSPHFGHWRKCRGPRKVLG